MIFKLLGCLVRQAFVEELVDVIIFGVKVVRMDENCGVECLSSVCVAADGDV